MMKAKLRVNKVFRVDDRYGLMASGTVDGRYVELDLDQLYFDGMLPYDYYIGYMVIVEYKKLFENKEYHMGEMHISRLELVEPTSMEFIQ